MSGIKSLTTPLSNEITFNNPSVLDKTKTKVEPIKEVSSDASISNNSETKVSIPQNVVNASNNSSYDPSGISFPGKNKSASEVSSENISQTINELKNKVSNVGDPMKKAALLNTLDALSKQYKYFSQGGNENKLSVFFCLMDKIKSSVADIKNGANINLDDILNKNNEIISKINQPGDFKIDELKSYLGEELSSRVEQVMGMRSDIIGARDVINNAKESTFVDAGIKNSTISLSPKMNEIRTALGDKVTSSEFQSFSSMISKINSGTKFNLSEISNLKILLNKVNGLELTGLSPDTKQKLEKLYGLVENVEKAQISYEANTKIYHGAVDKTIKTLDAVNVSLNLVPPDQRGPLTLSLRSLNTQFTEILKEGNPVKVALFTRFMEKQYDAMDAIRRGENVDLEKITKDHNLMMERIINKNPPLSNSELKEYLGEECFNTVAYLVEQDGHVDKSGASNNGGQVSAFERPGERNSERVGTERFTNETTIRKGEFVDPTSTASEFSLAAKIAVSIGVEGGASNIGTQNNKSSGRTQTSGLGLIVGEETVKNLSRVKPKHVIELFKKNPGLADAFKNARASVENLKEKTKEMNKSYESLNKAYKELKEFTTVNFPTVESSSVSEVDDSKSQQKVHDIIESQIREAIRFAEKAEEKLDLEVSGDSGNIAPLLEKFRTIITDLDVQTRKLIQNNLQKQMLDYYNLERVKENKDRNNQMDKAWHELINSSKGNLDISNQVQMRESA